MPTPADDAPLRGARASAWITFAAIILVLTGFFEILYGLAAVLHHTNAEIGSSHGVVVWNFAAWGWISLIVGSVQVLVAVGLFTGSGAARVIAIVLATISALAQFGIVTAAPLWALLVITLDVVIIYQLVVRWEEPA
jgi:hypothetical protein